MDPTSLVVGATGALTGIGGLWLNRRGQDADRAQAEQAARVAEQQAQLAESRQAVAYWQEIATERTHDVERERAEAERQRQLRQEVERKADTDRRRFVDELATLRALVLDDVAKAAGVDRIADVFTDDEGSAP